MASGDWLYLSRGPRLRSYNMFIDYIRFIKCDLNLLFILSISSLLYFANLFCWSLSVSGVFYPPSHWAGLSCQVTLSFPRPSFFFQDLQIY